MPLYGVPDIATTGMVSDIDPTQSGIGAFSYAANVRFENGRISRGPIFSTKATFTGSNPRALAHFVDENGTDHFLVKDNYGTIYEEHQTSSDGVSVSPPGYTPSLSDEPITTCSLVNVQYFNRPDETVQWRSHTSSGAFAKLSDYDSGFRDGGTAYNLPSDVRFKALRSYNSMLIGLGVNQGGTFSPNMVWWSDFATAAHLPPSNWAVTSVQGNATASTKSSGGTNLLAEMRGQIIDGTTLNNSFLIFSTEETWRMDATGNTQFPFSFARVCDAGLIATNCAISHGGLCYVFGNNDIFTTDGSQMQSIAATRIRDFVYSNVANQSRRQSFIFFNPQLNEIMFCFASQDNLARFPLSNGNVGCNRAAVFNINSKCWYLYDLPYVTCASLINTFTGPTFAQLTVPFAMMTGSFSGMAEGARDVVCLGSNASVAPRASQAAIRTFAPYDTGESSSAVDPFALSPALLIKGPMDGGDLSGIPAVSARLTQTKYIQSIYVKGTINRDIEVAISVGVSENQSDPPYYNEVPMTWTFDKSKLDYRLDGRFIGFKIECADYRNFEITGLDLELTTLGSRSR